MYERFNNNNITCEQNLIRKNELFLTDYDEFKEREKGQLHQIEVEKNKNQFLNIMNLRKFATNMKSGMKLRNGNISLRTKINIKMRHGTGLIDFEKNDKINNYNNKRNTFIQKLKHQ